MPYTEHTIAIHPLAPPKVPEGAPCNGCGVCCMHEPCPVGIFLTGRRRGACAALLWDQTQAQYRCGALVSTRTVLLHALPHWARSLEPILTPILRRMGPRWIAADKGCDSRLEVVGKLDTNTKSAESVDTSTTIVLPITTSANWIDRSHHD
jgi:hypothetical protein